MARGRETALWIAVAVLGVACVATGAWAAWAGVSDSALRRQVADSASRIASLETSLAAASQTASQPASTTSASVTPQGAPPASSPATVPAEPPASQYFNGTYYGYVRSFKKATGYSAGIDFAQFLTGAAAAKAATAHGDESPPPNDYYILNESTKVRTYPVSSGASIVVLGWKGADATQRATIPRSDFLTAVKPGGEYADALYKVTLVKGTVTKIEQVFLP